MKAAVRLSFPPFALSTNSSLGYIMHTRRTKSLHIQSPRSLLTAVQSPRRDLKALLSPRRANNQSPKVPNTGLLLHKNTESTQATVRDTVSPRSLSKGLKLLYALFPDRKRDGIFETPQSAQQGSKVVQNLLTPVKISYLQVRRKTKCGESADILTQLKRLFGKAEEIAPATGKQLSDVEKLSLEEKVKRRKLVHRKAIQSVPCVSPAATDICVSPVPASIAVSKPVPKRPAAQQRQLVVPSQSKTIVVNLPLLPFSQHKTYNDEANFTRNHLYKLALDGLPSDPEVARVYFPSKVRS